LSSNGFLVNLNYAVGTLLVVLGLYALIARKGPVKKVMGLIICQSGVFLFLVAMGLVGSGETRVVTPGFRAATLVNPVPHTLVLVALMLFVGIIALALSLTVRMRAGGKGPSSDESPEDVS
jgi:multicomponent Na+:H+ antiporter subunit C